MNATNCSITTVKITVVYKLNVPVIPTQEESAGQ